MTMTKILLNAADLREGHNIELKVTSLISDLDNKSLTEIRLTNSKGQFLAAYFTPPEIREIIRQLTDGVETLENNQHH
jgi:hypothetical protein